MDRSFINIGLHYGEHSFVPGEVIADVKKFGKDCKLAMIRLLREEGEIAPKQYFEWAEYFKNNKIYFCFLYSIQRKEDGSPESRLTKEIVDKMYEIAGEYFLGDSLGEMGNGVGRHFYEFLGEENTQFENLYEAKETYIKTVGEWVEASRKVGIKNIGVVESHTMLKYDLEAGVDIGYPELLLGNPEHILSFARGATRAYGKESFGGYIAHEWYGGVRHNDPLKLKRLPLIYKTAYMHGANHIFNESGFECIESFGEKTDENAPCCVAAREEIESFNKYIQKDRRLKNGPKVKVAFVSGYLDPYNGNSTSSGGVIAPVWGQRSRKEWDRMAPEHSWHILDEVYRSWDWHYPANFGEYDYSTAPGYGLYDVLPTEATLETMGRYEWLIFAGWNTMTEEIYEKLKEYVKNGGNLLISAAHMKTGNKRCVQSPYIYDGKLEEFLGCNLTGKSFRSNKSFKFVRESIAEGVYFHGTADHTKTLIDPIGSDGYTNYAEIEEKGCRKTIFLAESFDTTEKDYLYDAPIVVENKYGKGNVLFMCNEDYPGAIGIYTLYKIVIKAILAATHRNSDIKIIAGDKVRFSVYEDEKKYKVYLLNTDMNLEQRARVLYKENVWEMAVPSCGLESVEFDK